ncbi:MAG: hypothetical protein KJZ84_20820 [Bryobacteraceae bacterium]|nr:hypothetical protein [Bryobacteraceae bacterium]
MRKTILMAAAAVALLGASAQAAAPRFEFVRAADAARGTSPFESYESSASAWLWTDKMAYQPGERLKLWWTVRRFDDANPYTIVAYRINNQTGQKTFISTQGASEEPKDLFGSKLGDFFVVRMPDGEGQKLVGEGGLFGEEVGTIPEEYGMHTIVVQFRDYTGSRVVKSLYAKFVVVRGTREIAGIQNGDATWTNDWLWTLSGTVVWRSGTLTIEPGTMIFGLPGSNPASALLITRNAKIHASGTQARPIIMTSSLPVGQRRPGDWGGLSLLGKAITNWPTGEGALEGLASGEDTAYGGQDDDHDCGTLRYVRVEYAGAEFQPNEELNAITWGGCGKKTVSEFLQVRYGLDDNFEWFGGSNDGKYLVSLYAQDDHIDWQIGYRGRLQHILAVAGDDGSNRGVEADNNERGFDLLPRSNPTLWNMTIVGTEKATRDEGSSVAGIWLRRGTGGRLNNTIVTNYFQNGFEIRDNATVQAIANNELQIDGLLMWNNGRNADKPNTIEGQSNALAQPFLKGETGIAKRVYIEDPQLRRPLSYSDPDHRPAFASPALQPIWSQPPDDGFFDQWANWIGAFGGIEWTEEWADFIQEEDIIVVD